MRKKEKRGNKEFDKQSKYRNIRSKKSAKRRYITG